MHPASNPAATMALNNAFIIDSCTAERSYVAYRIVRGGRKSGQERMTHAHVLVVLRSPCVFLQERARFEDSATNPARAPDSRSRT